MHILQTCGRSPVLNEEQSKLEPGDYDEMIQLTGYVRGLSTLISG